MSYDAKYDPMGSLKDFHDRFSPNGEERSRGTSIPLLEKRRKLIREEASEVNEALEDYKYIIHNPGDSDPKVYIEALAKELADLLYVVYGTAEELDIPLDAVFETVHDSNMAKLWPDGQVHYNEYGKVIKPPTYKTPDLSYIHEYRV